MSFTDLATVKKILGIPDGVTKKDAAIQCAVDAVNSELLGWFCLDACEPTSYDVTGELDSDGGPIQNIRVRPYPLISVDTAELFGITLDADDFVIRGHSVVRFCEACRCRTSRHRGISTCRDFVATVTAGWDTTTPDPHFRALQYAAGVFAAGMFRGGAGDLKTEQIGRHRRTRFTPSELSGAGGAIGHPAILTRALSYYARPMGMATAQREP